MVDGEWLMDMQAIPKAVVLLSGGIDSVTLLHFVRKRLGMEED